MTIINSPMKIGIDIGHNCPPDTGSVGIKRECVANLEVGNHVIEMLIALGFIVVNCTPQSAKTVGQSLMKRCFVANDNNCDLFFSIHHNSFNKKAHGTECYAMSAVGRKYARQIVNSIASLGFENRGVKDGGGYAVIRNTRMPGILIECCFIDSQTDMILWDSKKIAEAIVMGIAEKLPKLQPQSVLTD